MAGGHHQRRATFFWQGLLILLPVVVLAAVGSWALRQDRASVEREARSRAEAVAAATVAQFETHFQALKFTGENGVVNVHIPPDIIWFSLTSNNVLSQALPLFWPPKPALLNPELTRLKPDKLEQWKTAQAAFAAGNWDEAGERYTAFLNGRTCFDDISEADIRDGLNNERVRAHALFYRATALERAGNIREAVEAYDGVIVGHLASGDSRTESGLSINHLAILKVLDLAQDQVSRLPQRWQTNPLAVVNWLEHEVSPFGEQIILRLRRVEPNLAAASRLGSLLNQNLQAAERNHENWRLYNEAAATLGEETPWPDQFWVEGRCRWLAVAQRLPQSVPNPFANRWFVAFPETLLAAAFDSTSRQADPTGDFAVRANLHGHALTAREGTATDWKRHELSFTARAADGHLLVTAILADPPAYFAAQQRRQHLLSLLLLVAAATCVAAYLWARRTFNEQLRLNDMKSNFVSSVSHELRAPIASVRLMAESLEHGKISTAEKQSEYFRFIGQECRRLSSLIENVLDFSRIEQGRKQYEFEPTDLGALVDQTVKLMQPYAAERGVLLKSEIRYQKSEMEVDGRAIQQALVNLIDNAIKHSPKDGTVTVELDASNSEILSPVTRHMSLSISDNGPGIPASEHEKIFERFYRLGSELRRETQGVGIGLSIVKHIVEAHGGRVKVESATGKGSRFTIELPVKNSNHG